MMYPEVRAAVDADTSPSLSAPGFDIAAHREQVRQLNLRQPREAVAAVEDLDAEGVPCRLFTPLDARPGLVVHAHGGGFVLNDVDVHDAVCRRFANRAGRAVLSVDYRRPPEAPFPAAPDDLDTVVRWLAAGHGPAGPYAAHGDSAGANLVLVAALRNPGFFSVVALIYPFLDPRASFASWVEGPASGFDPSDAAWYWEQYARTEADFDDPDLAPLLSDGCTPSRRSSSRPPSTTPCVTRGRSSRDWSPRRASRPSPSAVWDRPTASGGIRSSLPPSP